MSAWLEAELGFGHAQPPQPVEPAGGSALLAAAAKATGVTAVRQRPDALVFLDLASRCCLVAAFLLLVPVSALTLAELGFGYHSYALLNGDMAPSLGAGTLVVSHPISAALLEPGDVIAFHPPGRPGELVTRRVVAKKLGPDAETVVATEADPSRKPDPWLIPDSARVDRVVLHVPVVGYPAAALQTRLGRFLFLVLPAALLTLVLVNEWTRNHRRRLRQGAA